MLNLKKSKCQKDEQTFKTESQCEPLHSGLHALQLHTTVVRHTSD